MNATYTAAMVRGLVLSLIAGGSAFFTTLSLYSEDYRQAFIAAGVAFFTALTVRFAGEGTVDTRNDLQRQTDNAKFRGITPPVVITEHTVTPVTEAAAEIAKESEPDAGVNPVSPGDGV